MQFQWPAMLWSLLLIPALIAAYILIQRRRARYALKYASLSLVREALGRSPGWRRHVPAIFFLLGLAAMLIGLARPSSSVTLPAQEGTVILAMDSSGSMRADDMKPSRIEAAKAAARAFAEKQPPGVKIGVVSFSDSSFVVQAPTRDREAVAAAINRLTTQRGTAIGSGLLTSLEALFEDAEGEGGPPPQTRPGQATPTPSPTPTPLPKGVYEPAIIILLSDGESNRGPRPLDVIKQVADRGIRVYTVGVGSAEGVILTNQGRSMRVRLDEVTLKRLAEASDGEYFKATTETDLQSIYEKLSTELVFRKQETEITALFTGAAAFFSLLGGLLSLVWLNRLI